MRTKKLIPDPKTEIGVIRRYLHVLALLQNNKDPIDWNGSSLSRFLQYEEFNKYSDNFISDKTVRVYINDYLKKELGIDIDMEKGARRIELKSIPKDMLEEIINIYSTFVVKDSTRKFILKNFIKKNPYNCLWMLGRIYFASLARNSIEFDYITNSGYKIIKCIFNPYYILLRNNNLYLYGRQVDQDEYWLLILNRISDIRVLETKFQDIIPPVDDIFKDTLGSFIGKKYNVTIEYSKDIQNPIEQFLSIVEPKIVDIDHGKRFQAEFRVSDAVYLCKQLFLYGSNVKIVKPVEIRDMMVDMLNDSLTVYKG
jgi:hypothetical protein